MTNNSQNNKIKKSKYFHLEKCINQDIENITFKNCKFFKCCFDFCELRDVNFYRCTFINCTFVNCIVVNVEFYKCLWKRCNLNYCEIKNTIWNTCTLKETQAQEWLLDFCKIIDSYFQSVNWQRSTFSNTKLENVRLTDIHTFPNFENVKQDNVVEVDDNKLLYLILIISFVLGSFCRYYF